MEIFKRAISENKLVSNFIKMNTILLVTFLLYAPATCFSYEILLALPVASISLNNVFCGIARGLVNNGNSVTFLSTHPPNFSHENLTVIRIITERHFLQGVNQFEVNSTVLNLHVRSCLELTAQGMWEGFTLKKLLKNKDNFHAVLTPSFLNELAFPFLKDYKGVYISVYSRGAEQFVIARSVDTFSTINPHLDDPYFEDYSLRDKFVYSLTMLNNLNEKHSRMFPGTQEIIEMYKRKIGNVEKYHSLSRLTLIDGHHALDGVVPLMPKQLQIATVGITKPLPLPTDIEEFLSSGTGEEGIIFVSFGTYTRSTFIPSGLKAVLVDAFRQLPYRVVWQYAGVDLKRPDNLLVKKFVSQQDILRRPATKVFISHCSLSAVQEAAYYGVPVLALPLALDQHNNAERLAQRGATIVMNWRTLSADAVVEVVSTLIKQPSYSERMVNISRLLQDQKEPPSARAAWWIEYAVRQQGAPSLQHDACRHTVRSYCDGDLMKAWAAMAAATGFMSCLVLVAIKRVTCRCFSVIKAKNKTE